MIIFDTKSILKNLGAFKASKNILWIDTPYYLEYQNAGASDRRSVVFLGNDFKNTPGGVNINEYVIINNKCLDFIRRTCVGYKLYYACHPAETDEFELLDLTDFEVTKNRGIRELFLYNNLNEIKYVFSVCSGTSRAAYEMGLNSYVFNDLFTSAFSSATAVCFRDYLAGMPPLFYISDLSSELRENRLIPKKDESAEKHLAQLLDEHRGTVWFVAVDPGYTVIMSVLSRLIKKLSPSRKVGLLLMHHKRWDLVDKRELMGHFDYLHFFPIAGASLRPKNLFSMLKIMLMTKRFNINTGDIFMPVGPFSFLENCLRSYYKNNFSIAVIPQSTLEQTHYFEEPLDISDFKIKKTNWIFNQIIFPILGLERPLRLHRPSGRNAFYFSRYQRPINEVYDTVYVLKSF